MMHLMHRILVLLAICASVSVHAQDSHYWNIHYGTSGTLLGGAVIGSARDLSAIFYNPGALGGHVSPGLSLGTQVFELSNLSVDNAGDDGSSIDYLSIDPTSGLVAGQLRFDTTLVDRWTYGLLARQVFSFRLNDRRQDVLDVDDQRYGLYRDIFVTQDMSEYWGGISWARPLNGNISVGVTMFGAFRSHNRRGELRAILTQREGKVSGLDDVGHLQYFAARLLWKAGVSIHYGRWSFGATFTTPGLHVLGSGDAYVSNHLIGFSVLDSTIKDVSMVTDQRDIAARHNSPMSVGVGAAYLFGNRMRLHCSAEWFDGVRSYNVVDTHPDTTLVSGTPVVPVVREQLRSVLNAGIGLEYMPTDLRTYFFSIVSDMSAVDPGAEASLAISTWNIIHLTGGAVFAFGPFTVTAGLGYAFGSSSEFPRTVATTVLDDILNGSDRPATVRWQRLRLLAGVGYTM